MTQIVTRQYARGLDALKVILAKIDSRSKTLAFPDFLCPEVLTVLEAEFDLAMDYPITDRLRCGGIGRMADVIYTVDYFGRESEIRPQRKGQIIIRDAVWMPCPVRDVGENEYWFNSRRKFDWPNYGSAMLIGQEEILTKRESLIFRTQTGHVLKRLRNYNVAADILRRWVVPDFKPEYPSVVPLLVKDQRVARDFLMGRGLPMPGMWSDVMHTGNSLYRRLLLVPCDQRWSEEEMQARAIQIRDVLDGLPQ